MELYERDTCSFIVKVWVEEIDKETAQIKWRGHITDVFSRKRQYIEDLDAIAKFISVYLEQMRVAANNSEP